MIDHVTVSGPSYKCGYGHSLDGEVLHTTDLGEKLENYYFGDIGDPVEGEDSYEPTSVWRRPLIGRYNLYTSCKKCSTASSWTEFQVTVINDIVMEIVRFE